MSKDADAIASARSDCAACGCECCRNAADPDYFGDIACAYALRLRRLTRARFPRFSAGDTVEHGGLAGIVLEARVREDGVAVSFGAHGSWRVPPDDLRRITVAELNAMREAGS